MTKKIVFRGEPGANSHLAAREVYPDLEPVPCATFEDAFAAITNGDADLGMIPVENSVAGRVADIHHLMPYSGLHITARSLARFGLLFLNKGQWRGPLDLRNPRSPGGRRIFVSCGATHLAAIAKETHMSAVLLAVFGQYGDADRVRTKLVSDGFPTDRVELTSVAELGRAGVQPAGSRRVKFAQYFRTLLTEDDERGTRVKLARHFSPYSPGFCSFFTTVFQRHTS